MNARLPIATDFHKDLAASHAALSNPFIWDAIATHFDGALSAYPCHVENDKQGADLIIELLGEKPVLVDLKLRRKDYATHRGDIDVALELTYDGRPGWAAKRTLADFYLFVCLDTGRSACFRASDLHRVVVAHSAAWAKQYGSKKTCTAGTHRNVMSDFIPVPATVVEMAIAAAAKGVRHGD